MTPIQTRLAAAAVLFAIAVLAVTIAATRMMSTGPGPARPQILHVRPALALASHRATLGPPNAPYTLVEFGDYQCPPCGAMFRELPRVLAAHPGQVRLEFRNLPLTAIHPRALGAALAAEAAGAQGKFWQMHDWMYDHQTTLDSGHIRAAAMALGLDMTRFRADESGIPMRRVREDLADAKKLGVAATPTFILCNAELWPDTVVVLAGLSGLDEFLQRPVEERDTHEARSAPGPHVK